MTILFWLGRQRSAEALFSRSDYFESYAPVYLVSSRTGRLIFWHLYRFEASKANVATKLLDDSLDLVAGEIERRVKPSFQNEIGGLAMPSMEEVPEEGSMPAKDFRAPVPYRRIKPEYTPEAALYDIKATVDLMVYLDETGKIVQTDVVRWAGFGLDASVEKNVRSMNWRPASRNGKSLAMKFLLRYNFRKVEKE